MAPLQTVPPPWWENTRGELFVLAQFAIFGLLAFGPRTLPGLPDWSLPWQLLGTLLGGLFLCSGSLLALAGVVVLGRNLTPLITPKQDAELMESGPYRLVRHPIYSGIIQLSFGWGLWVHGWLTLLYAVILFLVFDRKLRREESVLHKTFPGYAAYAARVRRLIPFIY
jgi:protein-S-isoprenylcysteine O-methyltransferase Ste14